MALRPGLSTGVPLTTRGIMVNKTEIRVKSYQYLTTPLRGGVRTKPAQDSVKAGGIVEEATLVAVFRSDAS